MAGQKDSDALSCPAPVRGEAALLQKVQGVYRAREKRTREGGQSKDESHPHNLPEVWTHLPKDNGDGIRIYKGSSKNPRYQYGKGLRCSG